MNCLYCDGDRDDYVKFLPKANTGFNASIHKAMNEARLVVTGEYRKGVFRINYCPMCGKKLVR